MTEKKRFSVLMFAPLFPSRGGPEAFVNGNLVLSFLKAGWEVDVISLSSTGIGLHIDTSKCWEPLKAITNPVPDDAAGLLGKVADKISNLFFRQGVTNDLLWVWNAILLALKLGKRKKYDIVMSRCQPIWSHLPALVLSSLWKVPWVANWNDPAPVRKYPPPYGEGPEAKLSLIIDFLFRAICKRAAWHTFVCERLRNYITSYMPDGIKQKSSVIFHITASGGIIERPANDRTFTLCHSGSAYYRNWIEFLKGVQLFLSEGRVSKESIRVKFIGWQPEEFKDYIKTESLGSIVEIKEQVSYESSFDELAISDVLVVIETGLSEGIFLPSKIVDYVKLKKPILAVSPIAGTMSDMLNKYGGGISVDCTSPESIASGIETMYQSWKDRTLGAKFNMERLQKLFSEEAILSDYKVLINSLVSSHALKN